MGFVQFVLSVALAKNQSEEYMGFELDRSLVRHYKGGRRRRFGDQYSEDAVSGDGSAEVGQKTGRGKKETEKKISPLSTLESSFEALNLKKFDAAFAVDPIYHQTSAQFDEGGDMGLLLNNIGVYGGCRVLFDSKEVPGKCVSFENQCGRDQLIDLSFAKSMFGFYGSPYNAILKII
ncbi:unnamed protein product [Linum trigynum]|uniref:Condensin complex subunit 2 n=1 Tax=Linum trigynum TaxID=586398 RepID=A0AAV2GAD9_9ROSI